jgi:hypothetical protein
MPTSQQLGALCKCRPALNRDCSIKLDNFAGTSQNFLDYVIRRFNASSAGLKKPVGLDLRWDRRFTQSPDSTGAPSQPSGTGLQLMQFNNPTLTKNKNEIKKYDNSTPKKFD